MASFNNNASIEAYYNAQKAPVNAQITQAGNDYQAALDRLQKMKEQQDAENYRSYVRQQQELPGLMRASGNNGGMVDSAVASLANAYNQARANRAMEYEGNVAQNDLDYNNQMASLRAQLAQYDQMAAADKYNLAAAQAAARSRARTTREDEKSTYTPNRTNTAFVDAYEAAGNKDENAVINAYKAGRSVYNNNDYINSVRNKIEPSGGIPKPNMKSAWLQSQKDVDELWKANRDIDPFAY